jgi:hypothetical protein
MKQVRAGLVIWQAIAEQCEPRAQQCQLAIKRQIALVLLTAALSVVVIFVPVAAQSQDLARVTPDASLITDDVATTDASAVDWPPAGPPRRQGT